MPWLSWVVSNVLLALLLALAAWFMQRCLRRPTIAHVLWLLALVKLVTPPLLSVPVRESPNVVACALGVCGCDQHSPTLTIVRNRLPWALLAVWSAGAGATGWIAWRRWARFRRLLAHAEPAPAEWQSLATWLSSELALRYPPEILAVPGRLPPLVISGRRRPRLLLPLELLDQLNESQKKALLLHELAHIRRGDHLVRIVELAVGVAYWWLPGVSSIGRQLRACEESCCDAAVVARLPDARRDYAGLLLDVIDFTSPSTAQAVQQATAMSVAHGLERRIRAICNTAKETRRTWSASMLALAISCAVLPCQLRYEAVGRPAMTSPPTPFEPGAEASPAPAGGRENDLPRCCCPS